MVKTNGLRCKKTTKSGKRCRRNCKAHISRALCWQHWEGYKKQFNSNKVRKMIFEFCWTGHED